MMDLLVLIMGVSAFLVAINGQPNALAYLVLLAFLQGLK